MKKISKYQHLKCTFWIGIASVIVLVISFIMQDSPFVSILQNIFAGLVTGTVVTLISSLKSKELKDAEIEDEFMKEVRELYRSSRAAFGEYKKHRKEQDDTYSDAIYELVAELQEIEDFIGMKNKNANLVRILGKKPSDFFDEEENYSFSEQNKRYDDLYECINSSLVYDEEKRKTIDQQIEAIRRAHSIVNRKALNRSNEISNEKIEIETSVP